MTDYAALLRAFNIVAEHYRLDDAVREVAWESALNRSRAAYGCYQAIATSLNRRLTDSGTHRVKGASNETSHTAGGTDRVTAP